eukprot:14178943-Alexandrium_andersonii.AAC.1
MLGVRGSAAASNARAELGMARRPVEQSIIERSREARSDCVVFRDPRAKAVGVRAPWTPWRQPLSGPRVVARGRGRRL